MHKTKGIFKQASPPNFCLKVVCKKGRGGGVFSEAYSMSLALWSTFPANLNNLRHTCTAVSFVQAGKSL